MHSFTSAIPRLACVLVLLAVAACPAWASEYILKNIDFHANSINDNGLVVGTKVYSSSETKGVVYDIATGEETEFDYPGASETSFSGVNNNGDIVGSCFDGSMWYGLLYKNGSFSRYACPIVTATGRTVISTGFSAINDAGKIVGTFIDSTQYVYGLSYQNSAWVNLGRGIQPSDITNSGMIVSSATELDCTDKYTSIWVRGCNNNETASVGKYWDSSYSMHGFTYVAGEFNSFSCNGSNAEDINNAGIIVGENVIAFPGPSLLALAIMSRNVYDYDNRESVAGYDYLADSRLSPLSGYHATAYRNAELNQIVIAFRGTQLNLKNLVADSSFVTGTASESLKSYVEKASEFLLGIHQQYPTAAIVLTGHSLGGAIAQLLGWATGCMTRTFNAPGTCDLVAQLVGFLFPTFGVGSTLSGTNVNYRVQGDQVSLAGSSAGITTAILPAPGSIAFSGLTDSVKALMADTKNILAVHGIETVISQLQGGVSTVAYDSGPLYLTLLRTVALPFVKDSFKNLFRFDVTDLGLQLIDPLSGTDYVLAADSGSPHFASIVLPAYATVASYRIRAHAASQWSSYASLQPGEEYALPTDCDKVQFQPLDASEEAVSITDPIFAVSFDSTGAFSGSVRLAATPVPPAVFMLLQ